MGVIWDLCHHESLLLYITMSFHTGGELLNF